VAKAGSLESDANGLVGLASASMAEEGGLTVMGDEEEEEEEGVGDEGLTGSMLEAWMEQDEVDERMVGTEERVVGARGEQGGAGAGQGLAGDREERAREKPGEAQPGTFTQVFVRGIPFKARPLDLVELFESKAGTVSRIEGMFFNGRASGRAWVTFEEAEAAGKALELDGSDMAGRSIEVYTADSRPARQALRLVTEGQGFRSQPYNGESSDGGRRGGDLGGWRGGGGGRFEQQAAGSKTLFLGRLPLSSGREDIADAIHDWAGVENIRLGIRNGEFQGYAHIDFESESACEAAMSAGTNLEVLGRAVRVDFASSSRRDGGGGRYRERGRGGGGRGFRGGGRGGGGGGFRGGRGGGGGYSSATRYRGDGGRYSGGTGYAGYGDGGSSTSYRGDGGRSASSGRDVGGD
jgi:RNA recognition motif-containing protein